MTIYFEDIVLQANKILDTKVICVSDWTRSFIMNVSQHLQSSINPRLSVNQANALKKVLPTFIKHFTRDANEHQAYEDAIINPTYRVDPYVSQAVQKEVRHLGANYLGFRFRYDDYIIKDLKARASSGNYKFDRTYNIWIVEVNSYNFPNIESFIKENKFHIDENTRKWLGLCKGSSKTIQVNHDTETDCIIVNTINADVVDFVKHFLEGIFI